MTPLITITSDMAGGLHYLAALKGALYTANFESRIVDVTHDIDPFNVRKGAYILQKTIPYFPTNTIHILHVNASEAKGRLLLAKHKEQYFILFDNGSGPLIFGQSDVVYFEIEKMPEAGNLFIDTIVHTVNQLSKKQFVETPTTPKIQTWSPNAVGREGHISGHISYIDNFQNGITNISRSLFEQCIKDTYTVDLKGYTTQKISNYYSDVMMGELVVFFNKDNLLEIAVNNGKAAQLMGFKTDSSILIYE